MNGLRHRIFAACLCTWAGLAAAGTPVLTGLIHDDDAPRALFRDGADRDLWRRPGDPVGPCRLARVAADHVRLDCPSGMREMVLASTRSDTLPDRHPVALPDTAVRLDGQALDALMRDRQRLVNQVSLEPVVVDGTMRAWKIRRLPADGELVRLGLMEDDLITAVDGIPVSQGRALADALQVLPRRGAVQLSVERGGAPLRVHADWQPQD